MSRSNPAGASAVSTSNTAPGPRGSRWLGMAPELQRDQLGTYERLVAEYGDVVRLVVGPPGLRRELYLVTHPDGVQQVLAGDPRWLLEEHALLRRDCRVPGQRAAHQRRPALAAAAPDCGAAVFAPAHCRLRRRDG